MPEIAENLAARLSEDEQAIDPTVHIFKAGLRDDCGLAAARCEVLPRLGEAGLQHHIADFAGGEKDSLSAGSPAFLPFAEGDGRRAPRSVAAGWRSLDAGLSSAYMPRLWLSLLAGWLVAIAANGCSVDQRSLGSFPVASGDAGAEIWVPFGPVALHPALANACRPDGTGLCASEADPTLTADELEMYFSSNPNTDWDIWLVQRTSSTAPWGTPARVEELSSTSLDETPEVSADGLTIYLASERPGGVAPGRRLWVSHRATRTDSWPQPGPVTDFTTGGDQDSSPTLQRDQLMMVFASLRGGDWDLYMTTRRSTADPWGPPTALTQLNSTAYDWDPAVYRGGNSIVFASRRLNTLNSLFHATRGSAAEPFSAPQEATELNILGNAADPWLSDDGKHIVFDSRQNPSKIYEASR